MRRTAHRIAGGAAGAILASFVLAASASACSCLGPEPGKEKQFYRDSFKRADGAIVGKLLRVRAEDENDPNSQAVYVFRITESFKKRKRLPEKSRVRVNGFIGDGLCGLAVPEGGRTGLFLVRDNKVWTAGLCDQVPPRKLRKAAKRGSGKKSSTAAPGCSS